MSRIEFDDLDLPILGAPEGVKIAAGISGSFALDSEGYPEAITLDCIHNKDGVRKVVHQPLRPDDTLYPRIIAALLVQCRDRIAEITEELRPQRYSKNEHAIGAFEALGRR